MDDDATALALALAERDWTEELGFVTERRRGNGRARGAQRGGRRKRDGAGWSPSPPASSSSPELERRSSLVRGLRPRSTEGGCGRDEGGAALAASGEGAAFAVDSGERGDESASASAAEGGAAAPSATTARASSCSMSGSEGAARTDARRASPPTFVVRSDRETRPLRAAAPEHENRGTGLPGAKRPPLVTTTKRRAPLARVGANGAACGPPLASEAAASMRAKDRKRIAETERLREAAVADPLALLQTRRANPARTR